MATVQHAAILKGLSED